MQLHVQPEKANADGPFLQTLTDRGWATSDHAWRVWGALRWLVTTNPT